MIEEFELAVSIAESNIIENMMNEAMDIPELLALVGTSYKIKNSFTNEFGSWQKQIKEVISTEPLSAELLSEIEYYQEVKAYNNDFFLNNTEDIVLRLDLDSSFYYQATDLIAQQKRKYNPLFKHYFCEKWYQTLTTDLQQEKLDKLDKNELLQELYQRANTMNQLNEIDDAQIDEQKNLRLWDMAKAKLTKKDIHNLKKIALSLKKNNELQKIAEKLGRMANKVDKAHTTLTKTQQIKPVKIDNNHFAGDIIGIHESDALERLLPIEGMFLASPDLEAIFYKRLADKRLSTYQLQSTEQRNQKVTKFEKKSRHAEIEKGPFIIAIDASGSMMGAPEQYAKAFAYGLMQVALAEDRDCYVMIFSTQQVSYKLTKENGLSEMLSFLSYSFNGGTDLAPVLEQSIDLMSSEAYVNADLIVISDFISPKQPESLLTKIAQIKEQKNRFHALNLSKYGNPELLAMFDHYWEYHPSTLGRLKQLFQEQSKVERPSLLN